jgi:hypothetical protein
MAHTRLAWTVVAVLMASVPATMTPAAVVAEPANVFFGSLGAQGATVDSTAAHRREYENARADGMDFLAIVTPAPSASLVAAVASANLASPGRFVALSGWQYGPASTGNHVNVLDADNVSLSAPLFRGYGPFFRSLLPRLRDDTAHPPIVQLPQPGNTSADYGILDMGSPEAFARAVAPYVQAIQLEDRASGSVEGGRGDELLEWRPYLHYLNAGLRLAPTADTRPTGRSGGFEDGRRTAIVAGRLTGGGLLESIRRRRVYASEDRNLRVGFHVNGGPMGSLVPVEAGSPIRIEVTLSDPDEPGAIYWISLRRDTPGGSIEASQELAGTDLVGDGRVVFAQFTRRHVAEYFLLHVLQQGDGGTDRVWTAPVWLTAPGPPAGVVRADRGAIE